MLADAPAGPALRDHIMAIVGADHRTLAFSAWRK